MTVEQLQLQQWQKRFGGKKQQQTNDAAIVKYECETSPMPWQLGRPAANLEIAEGVRWLRELTGNTVKI